MIFSLEKKRTDALALCDSEGLEISYGELRRLLEFFGGNFDSRCLIFCLCENSPAAVIGYLGALEGNVAPLLLGAEISRIQFDVFYQTYKPPYIWASGDCEGKLGDCVCEKIYEAYGFCLWKTAFSPYPIHDSLALLLTTSGSIGSPKLVRISRENLESNAAAILQYLKLDETERPITTLPMQYTYGLSVINSHLLAGACILMTKESYVQNGFWDFLEQQRATSFAGVPYTYETLKRLHIFEKTLPSLRSVTQAGGKLPPSLQEEVGVWAREHGIGFYVMYGQTEATARMAYLPPEDCLAKPGSIGIAIPGGRFWLVDENKGEIKEAGRIGELVYEGANVSLGYAEGKEDLLLGDVNGGVLFTGDMARVDEDGYFYVTGRKKRFIKLYGMRVSLDACEQMLASHFPGVEFACLGVDNRLEIYGADRTVAEQAVDVLSDELRLSRKAFVFHYLPYLPKNETGKIRYTALAEGSSQYPAPFSMGQEEKDIYMTEQLCGLTTHHRERCPQYAAMLDALGYQQERIGHYAKLPYLPVTLFKRMTLSSIGENADGYQTLTSSGTSGQARSRIVLDGDTRTAQQQALASIGTDFLGSKRMPMLVIDCPAAVKGQSQFSARAAGILGFSLFGTKRVFALNDDMTLNTEAVTEFLSLYGKAPFLMFGFTYIVWWHFYLEQERQGISFDCGKGILVHGGGWKKLQQEAVSKQEFKSGLLRLNGIARVHDYYGMAEQTGSIFMECEHGHLHCSDYSAVLFRRPQDFSICDVGERGLIQVMSVLPKSYPGHNLLTEDEGRLLGVDDCPCGRKGVYFEALGRAEHAELRGCGDTYAGTIKSEDD